MDSDVILFCIFAALDAFKSRDKLARSPVKSSSNSSYLKKFSPTHGNFNTFYIVLYLLVCNVLCVYVFI